MPRGGTQSYQITPTPWLERARSLDRFDPLAFYRELQRVARNM